MNVNLNSRSERVYGWLLRIYPHGFRAEYGEAMGQHFRDLWRDARGDGAISMGNFWMGIVVDTLISAVRARFSERRKGSTGAAELNVMKVPSFRFLFLAFLFPLLAGVGMWLYLQPRVYMAQTHLLIERVDGQKTEGTGMQINGGGDSSFDPYFLQTQFEVIKSGTVFEQVVRELNLGPRFEAMNGGMRPKDAEAAEFLKQQVKVIQRRNPNLVSISAYSEEAGEAAVIANKVAEVYRRVGIGKAKIGILDVASRPLRPVRPNLPVGVVAGSLMSGVLAAVAALLLRIALGSGRRGAMKEALAG